MDGLTNAIAAAARAMPKGQVEQLARSLEKLSGPGTEARAFLEAAAAVGPVRYHSQAIASAWETQPLLPGVAVGFALLCAAEATSEERSAELVEIAWTGPATPVVPVRRIQTILLDLIGRSARELLIVSFAAYKVPSVIEGLRAAAERGVDIRLVLEGTADSGGALTFDARAAFSILEGLVRFYAWPLAQRGTSDGSRGALHAKAIVADRERALVSSANLTGSALELNMELGLLVEQGPIPRRLADHFSELMTRGVLRQVL